jgi:hypothetical protein
MRWGIVSRLDQFAGQVGIRPFILSDYRPGDLKQHGVGRAIDTYWPISPLGIWQDARRSFLFSGIGIYLNEKGNVSFHFDDRGDRFPEDPALWGAHVLKGENSYTGSAVILDAIKKKGWVGGLLLAGLVWYLYQNQGH